MKDKYKEKANVKVIFVGAFGETLDGAVGGQLHACQTLIKSEISRHVDFIFIDSTMETVPPPSLRRRAYLAAKRLFNFTMQLIRNDFDTALIFTSAGFSFLEKGLMVLVADILGVRTVISPRSGLLIDNIEKSLIMQRYVRFILSRCDAVMCQSDSWAIYYQKLTHLPSSHFVVINNWLNPAAYFNLQRNLKSSCSVDVLFLGWIEKNKGIYELLSAVRKFPELQSGFNFVICGKGSELSNVQDLVKLHGLSGCFDFRGWVANNAKMAELGQADVLVMPSHREGLPNSLLEAMASGLCVIATSVGAIPDVIKNKRNGLLIEPYDVDQLANSLLYLSSISEEARKEMGKAAKGTIAQFHDINNVWLKVYDMLNPKNDDCSKTL